MTPGNGHTPNSARTITNTVRPAIRTCSPILSAVKTGVSAEWGRALPMPASGSERESRSAIAFSLASGSGQGHPSKWGDCGEAAASRLALAR